MKTQVITLLSLLLIAQLTLAKTGHGIANNALKQNPGICFTENKGQVYDQNYKTRPDVLYGAMAGNMAVHIKNNGVSYQLYRVDKYKEVEDPNTKKTRQEIDQQTIYRVDLFWLNANKNYTKTEDEALPGYNNYYLEGCPNGALNVKSYKGVTLHNLYNGIDLHYYEKSGELKHDYLVAANADYKQIQIKVEGAEISVNEDGSLLMTTPIGKIQEGAPLVYQNGKSLGARWKIEKNVLSFEVEGYNPNYQLIIDPVTRVWASYYGGSGEEKARACATDNSGNSYLTGSTIFSTGTVIATIGSHQTNAAGSYDAYLVKFNNNGVRQWGTFYGGSNSQRGFSCITDALGNVYMSGETGSATGTVIVTPGSHQTTYGGGVSDAFLVKFNTNGIRQWCTYYGGLNTDSGNSLSVDINGDIYMMGSSDSNNGISTPSSHQVVYAGAYDAFLVKFNSNGVRQWGTYYGGTGQETGFSCATTLAGDVYIAGSTIQGTNGIASVGSHQTAYGGGTFDGFLAKFNTNGIRQWGTYYGGSGDDRSFSCVADASGNVYMSGNTSSNTGTIMSTVGSHQQSNGGGASDAFLIKFDGNGVRQWGTYYGGIGEDLGFSCLTDASGSIYLAGFTDSNTGTTIATSTSHQSMYGGGLYDCFLAKFDNNGNRQWGTYYGGAGEDRAYSSVTDNNGNLYLAGYTDSNTGTAIATVGSHQSVYGGGTYDGFLAKFDVCDVAPLQPTAINGNTIMCSGSGSNSYSIASVAGATSYTWSLPAGWSGSSNTNSISATPGTSGVFSVAAGNACGASTQQTLSVIVNPLPTITASSSSSILCEGESATLTASGASTYTFNPGGTGASIVVAPPVTSVYTISGTDANGCSNTFIFTQNVGACVGINSNDLIASSVVEMYPNPTEGKINLELRSNSEVTIINSLGQVIYETKVSSGKHELDLEHLAKDLYVVKVKNGKDIETIKVIKD